jgi:acyl-CoA synthetase (AMP-forming)/AMP-acid ligase II
VALLLHDGFEFPEALLACHRIGACVVPINFRLPADEISTSSRMRARLR